MPLQHRRSGLR